MDTQTMHALKRSFGIPDQSREFPYGKLELVNLDEATLGRLTLMPGWKWSTHVRPIVKTESCQVPHLQYVLAGRLLVEMDDGTRLEVGPGDAALIPPGHDAWVVGNEPFMAIDFLGMKEYAKEAEEP